MMVNSSDTSRRATTAIANFLWTAKANLDEPVVQYLGQRILDEAATGDKEAALSELQHFIPALENEQLEALIEELRSLWSSPVDEYTSRTGQPEQQISSSSDPWSSPKASAAHTEGCVSPQHIRRGDRRIVTVVATAGRRLDVGSAEATQLGGETVPVTSGRASDTRTSAAASPFMAPLHDASGGMELPLSRPGSSGTLGSPPLGGPNSFFGLRSSSPLCSSPSFSPVVGSPATKSGACSAWGAVGTPVRGGGGYGGSSRSPSGSGSAFGSPRFHMQDRMTPAGPGPPCSSAAMAAADRDGAHGSDKGNGGAFDSDSPRQDASSFFPTGGPAAAAAAAVALASQPARDGGEGSEPGSPNSFLPHLVSFNSGSSTGADSGLTGALERMPTASGSPPPEAGTLGARFMGSARPLSPSGLALEGPRPRHVRVMPNDVSRGGDMGASGWNSGADEDGSPPLQRRSSAGSAVGEDSLPRGISCSDLKDQLPDELLPTLDDLLPSGDVFHFEDHHPQMQGQHQQQVLQHHQKQQLVAQQQRQQLAAAAAAAFGATPAHLPPIQARRALAAASLGELHGGGSPLTPRLSSPSVLPRQNLGTVGMPPGVWGGGSPAHMSTPRGGGLGGTGGPMLAGDFYNSPRAELTGSPRPPGAFSPGPGLRMGRFVPNMEGTLDSPRGTGFHRPAYGLDPQQMRGSPREHPQRGQWVGELGPMDGPMPSNLGQGQGGSARAGWPSQGVSPDELLEITAVISRKFPNVPPERLASILLQNGGDIPRNLELLLQSEGVTGSPRYGPPPLGGSPHRRFGPPPMDYGPPGGIPPQQPWSPGGFPHGPQKAPPPLLRPESMSPINLCHRHSMSSGELEANRHKRDLGRGGVMGGGPGPLLDRPLPDFPGRRGPGHGQQQPGSPWGHGPPPPLQHERGLMNEMGGHMGRGGPVRGGMGGYGWPDGELMMENGGGALQELQANLGGGPLWMDGADGMGPFGGPPGHLGGHGGGQGPNYYDMLEAEELRVMGALCEQVTAASLTGDDALLRELQTQWRMANRQRSGLGPGFLPHGLAGHPQGPPQGFGRGDGPGHGPPPPPWANLPTLDLAGRTVGDALPILKRELENMREAAATTNQIREMVVHVGPNLNAKPTKQAQRLPGAVEKYLQEDHAPYLLLIPGLLKVVVRPPGQMPPGPDMWPGGPP